MTQQNKTKTFVRGSFLYLDEAGGYEERQNIHDAKQKVVEDRIGISKYQQEMKQRVVEAQTKKKQNQSNKIVEKPVLIPIRDTPVEPIPQPVLDNQKCERTMQEQFDYFQTYVSLKQKERQFQEEQNRTISDFLIKQRQLKERQIDNPPTQSVAIVMQKQQSTPNPKTKKIIKIKIKKKTDL